MLHTLACPCGGGAASVRVATQSPRVAASRAPAGRMVVHAIPRQRNEEQVQDGYLSIGAITSAHGIRGEVKIRHTTDFPEERLGEAGSRWISAPQGPGDSEPGPPESIKIEAGRVHITKGGKGRHNESWLVKFEGVDTRNDAELLVGRTLMVSEDDRLDDLVDEDEFWVRDVIGLRVFLESTGEQIGEVVDIYDGTGTHDTIRIALAEEKTVLMPFAADFVVDVDLEEETMVVSPPAGLLELAQGPPGSGKKAKQERRQKAYQQRRKKKIQERGATPEGAVAKQAQESKAAEPTPAS